MKPTFLHIDVAKGLGILLVALSHNQMVNQELYHLIFSFHVPLFFFLAGLFFTPATPLTRLIGIKTDALLKPYLVFMLIGGIYVVYRGYAPLSYLGYVAHGTPFSPLWFIPQLWLVFVFSWLLVRLSRPARRRPAVQALFLLALLLAGYEMLHQFRNTSLLLQQLSPAVFGIPLWPPQSPLLPTVGLVFGVDILLLTGAYFLTGFLLNRQVLHFKFNPVLTGLSLVLFAGLHYFFDYTINLYMGVFDHLLISTLQSVAGIYLALTAAYLLARLAPLGQILAYIGRGSLFILIFHNLIQGGLYLWLTFQSGHYLFRNAFMAYLVGCAAPLLLWEMAKRSRWLSVIWLPLSKSPRSPDPVAAPP